MTSIRQSDLKLWSKCPLMYKYQHIDQVPRLQSGSLTFGSVLHDVIMHMEIDGDLEAALVRFKELWCNPEQLGAEYRIDYYVRGTNWKKFLDQGPKIIKDWWSIISWETDLVLAREYEFDVPIGNGHTLHGTVDKLTVRYHAKTDQWVLLISDYKTNRKTPTYEYLEEDLQFTAYAYASLQPEFWANLPGGRGMELMEQYKDYPRRGEWVALTSMKRMDAGERTQRHYNRLTMACDAMADSIDLRIFVPNISGESCRYCDFRKHCGLPEIEE